MAFDGLPERPKQGIISREKLSLEERVRKVQTQALDIYKKIGDEIQDPETLERKVPFESRRGDFLYPLYYRLQNILRDLGPQYEQGTWNREEKELDVLGGSMRYEQEAMDWYDPDDSSGVWETRRSVTRQLGVATSIEEVETLAVRVRMAEEKFAEVEETWNKSNPSLST